MGLITSIKNFFKGEKQVTVQIDPETVKAHHLTKAISYENAVLKAEKAKLEKQLAQLRQRDEDREEENKVKVYLNKEKQSLQMKSLGRVFSLRAFFQKYFSDAKFRKKLGFYSFDRSTRISDFEDFCISEDGDFVLIGTNGERIIKMERLKDIFQSVGALGVDTSTAKIPINLDKEGAYIENIMVYEAPELLETGDKLRFAKARKRPVYEVIASLNEKISILTQDLAEAEMLNTSLQDKVESLEGSLKVTEEMSETSRKELTKNEERLIGIDRIYRQTQQDMMKLQKINEVQEDALRLLEGIKSSLMKVAEREGSTDSFNDAINKIDMIKDILHQKTLAPAPIIQSEKSK
jgi:hypothetical protein